MPKIISIYYGDKQIINVLHVSVVLLYLKDIQKKELTYLNNVF